MIVLYDCVCLQQGKKNCFYDYVNSTNSKGGEVNHPTNTPLVRPCELHMFFIPCPVQNLWF